ncbi:MAG: DNA ligase [Gammaproteobacteria bacterium (ex Lamellibrachia satsuma)]|nr:MAG: DNA ligase [Gammaproteobacteria bacterium (ex Lamellibrachia satsuma)]RRS34841.1 MAG: DNA ligase [Gammaproteobacteria bacterium (ex Lamellibrachia satsuma)]RRS35805.1 MAG: DNA ligase [Gammaproteobacteria bacterium (ex Lamellibrachia satsuma)]
MKKTGTSLVFVLFILPFLAVSADAPNLLLLKKYRPGMEITGWYMSEKLDGVRAYWNGRQLTSRQGNPFAAPDWFTKDFPPFELDGELWIGRGRFEEVASITSRYQPHDGWQRVTYNIFEVPNAPGNLGARLGRLQSYLKQYPVSRIRIIPQTRCSSDDHLQARLAEVEAAGGEGLVLRNPDALYEFSRSRNALKVKRFDDREGRVVGYRPGKGKYTGKVGALWVELEDGRRFYIGTGLSDREREDPPSIGSIITFKHQGYTANGIPRFASFLRIRQKL